MSLSKHSFIGRLTRDPEVKELTINNEKVKVANFTVAVDEDGRSEETDFYDVVAWRKLAENVDRFLGKGRLVYVEGRPKRRSYTKDIKGEQVTFYAQEIRANLVQFLDKPADAPTTPAEGQAPVQEPVPQGSGDDDAPF